MAQKIFVKIEGIPGESTDQRHKDEIEVLNWSWSFLQQQSGPRGGGAGGGKPVVSGIAFTHKIDKSSPLLMSKCLTGAQFREAILSIQSSRPDLDNLVFKAQDVLISSVVLSDNVEDPYPAETVTYTFKKITEEYTPLKPDGTPGTKITSCYDITANKPC